MARTSTIFFVLLLVLYIGFAIASLVLHAIARGDSGYRPTFQPSFHAFGLTGACLMIVLQLVIALGFVWAPIFEYRPVVTAVVFFQSVAVFFTTMALGMLIERNDLADTDLGRFRNGTLTVDFLAVFFGFSVTTAYAYRSLKRYALEHK